MRYRVSSSRVAFCAVAMAGLLAGGTAVAGLAVTVQEQDARTGAITQQSMLIGDAAMKMDAKDAIVIFRADQNRTITLDPGRHSYIEITPADRQAMDRKMAEAKAAMAARLQAMPEAQRKQIEAMTAQQGMAAGSPARRHATFEKAGGKTVGRWHCTVYRKRVNGEAVEDDCIAPLATLGLSRADFKVLEAMGRSMAPHGGSGEPQGFLAWDEQTRAIGFEGLPIESVRLFQGKPAETTTVKSIDRVTVPAGAFDIPPGYTRRDMPGFGGHAALPPPQ